MAGTLVRYFNGASASHAQVWRAVCHAVGMANATTKANAGVIKAGLATTVMSNPPSISRRSVSLDFFTAERVSNVLAEGSNVRAATSECMCRPTVV